MADPSETTQASLGPSDPESAELLGAVRALSVQVGGLQAELQSLRQQSRSLPTPADAPGWDTSTAARPEKSPWMRSLDRPGPRYPAVPRLLLEVVFLAAVAGAAAIAELEAAVIVVLMAGAWALVALAEWLAARSARRYMEISGMPLAGAGSVFANDPAWFSPRLEPQGSRGGEVEDTERGEESTPAPRLPPRSDD